METFEHYFTEAEEKKLFRTINRVDCLAAKRDYFWMLLMRQTGVRLGVLAGPDPRKIAKAREKGIELPRAGLRVIDAKDSLDAGRLIYRAETNKRNKQYYVRLNNTAVVALEGLLKIHRKQTSNWDIDMPYLDMPLILSRHQQALKRRTYQERMTYWCTEAGIRIGTPHWWRHTLAKRYVDKSDSPMALRRLQAVLGHSDIETTAIYTQPSIEDLDRVMRAIQ